MTTESGVSWTDGSAAVVTGCDYQGPGCRGCFAAGWAWRFSHHPNERLSSRYKGTVAMVGGRAVWTGKVNFNEDVLRDVLDTRQPMRWFMSRDGDLCHDSITDLQLAKIFALPALKPADLYIFLSKRSRRLAEWVARQPAGSGPLDVVTGAITALAKTDAQAVAAIARSQQPLSNAWLGFSAEDQRRFDSRWYDMRQVAERGWNVVVSLEPLLGPVDLPTDFLALGSRAWVIVGGESGPRARALHLDWLRHLRDQCEAVGVLFHLKQLGQSVPIGGAEDVRQRLLHSGSAGDLRDLYARCAIVWPDGRRLRPGRALRWWQDQDFAGGDPVAMTRCPIIMRKVGVKAAGHTLDGQTHQAVPPLPSFPVAQAV